MPTFEELYYGLVGGSPDDPYSGTTLPTYGDEPIPVVAPSSTPTPAPSGSGGGGGGSPYVAPAAQEYYDYLNDFWGIDNVDQSSVTGLMTQLDFGGLAAPGSTQEASIFDMFVLPPTGSGTGRVAGGFVAPIEPGRGGGGGFEELKTAVFSEIDLNIAGSPDWWRAMAPDVTNPLSSYQTMANLMIPMLSPEDQRTVATNLFQTDPEQFGRYDPELLEMTAIPETITADVRRRFFSGERAQKTLNAFDELLTISGKTAKDFGPGYNFLRGLADTMRDFKLTSGAQALTETQQGQLLGALDPQLAQTKSKQLSAYGPIAKSFTSPFFSAGSLTGKVRSQYGDILSPPNRAYF